MQSGHARSGSWLSTRVQPSSNSFPGGSELADQNRGGILEAAKALGGG